MTKAELLERLLEQGPRRRVNLETKVISYGKSIGVHLTRASRALTMAELEFVAQRMTDLHITGSLEKVLK